MKQILSFDEFTINENLTELKSQLDTEIINENLLKKIGEKLSDAFEFMVNQKSDISSAFENSIDLISSLLNKNKVQGLLALANLYQNLDTMKSGWDDIKQKRAEEAEAALFSGLEPNDQQKLAKLANLDADQIKNYNRITLKNSTGKLN